MAQKRATDLVRLCVGRFLAGATQDARGEVFRNPQGSLCSRAEQRLLDAGGLVEVSLYNLVPPHLAGLSVAPPLSRSPAFRIGVPDRAHDVPPTCVAPHSDARAPTPWLGMMKPSEATRPSPPQSDHCNVPQWDMRDRPVFSGPTTCPASGG